MDASFPFNSLCGSNAALTKELARIGGLCSALPLRVGWRVLLIGGQFPKKKSTLAKASIDDEEYNLRAQSASYTGSVRQQCRGAEKSGCFSEDDVVAAIARVFLWSGLLPIEKIKKSLRLQERNYES